MSAVAPKAHLALCCCDLYGYYKQAVKAAMDGSRKTERTVWVVRRKGRTRS